MDTKALFKLGYGLYVIGTEYEGALSGCTANTVVQITGSPVCVNLNLLISRPLFTPHKSTAFANCLVGIFITNSPVFLIISLL
ncbi:MAG: hypothetical protein IJ936_00255, partial [Peptococcaceae bacterium]|nr:hypothetical protein [Peptococcaceae bacterium]